MGRKVRNFVLATIAVLLAVTGALWAAIAVLNRFPGTAA